MPSYRTRKTVSPLVLVAGIVLLLGLVAILLLMSGTLDLRQQASDEVPNPTAKTVYVSTTGSDSGQGTIADPYQTLNRAVQTLQPGDTLLIRAGTYAEALEDVIPSGTSWVNPITIQSEPGAEVILLPPNTDRSDREEVRVIHFVADSFIILDGLILDARNTQYDGVRLSQASSNIRIKNVTVRNAPMQGILIQDGSSNTEIDSVKVYGNGTQPGTHGIYVLSSNTTIRNSWIGPNFDDGIKLRQRSDTDGVYLENTIIEANTFWGARLNVTSEVRGVKVANNVFYSPQIDQNQLDAQAPYPEIAAVWRRRQQRGGGLYPQYQGRYIPAGTVVVRQDAENIRLYHNTFWGGHPTGGSILLMERPRNVDIANNIFASLYSGAVAIEALGNGANSQIVFRNNLLEQSAIDFIVPTRTGPRRPPPDVPAILGQIQATSILRTDTPVFADPNQENFQLRPGSYAIDRGITIGEVGEDALGIKRPQGTAPDLGAYEFVPR